MHYFTDFAALQARFAAPPPTHSAEENHRLPAAMNVNLDRPLYVTLHMEKKKQKPTTPSLLSITGLKYTSSRREVAPSSCSELPVYSLPPGSHVARRLPGEKRQPPRACSTRLLQSEPCRPRCGCGATVDPNARSGQFGEASVSATAPDAAETSRR